MAHSQMPHPQPEPLDPRAVLMTCYSLATSPAGMLKILAAVRHLRAQTPTQTPAPSPWTSAHAA